MTQECLREKHPGLLDKTCWPPSLPDINPLDFSPRTILEEKACKKLYKNIDDLN